MAARAAFTDGVIPVDHWLLGTPPGSPNDGDIALLPQTGLTGAFLGNPGALGFWSASTASWRFILPSASPGLRGTLLFQRGSGATQFSYFGHNGTTLIGPFLTSQRATADASNNIASEEFGD
jgi:hypothetical protein